MAQVCSIFIVLGLVVFTVGYRVAFRRHDERDPLGLWLIKIAFPAAAFILLWQSITSSMSMLLSSSALVLMTASIVLFLMTATANRQHRLSLAFHRDEPSHLNTKGPYRFVRHPYYTSYLTYFLGAALASGTIVAIPLLAMIALIYRQAAITEERKFLASPLAGLYTAYTTRTGRFVPSLRRLRCAS